MSDSVYADTSWLAKLYLHELESDDCIDYLNAHPGAVYVSLLSDVEVTAAISKAHKDSIVLAVRAIDNYKEDCTFGFLKKLTVDEKVFSEAERIAEQDSARLSLRSLDILHIATARRHGLGTIASFDKRLRDAAGALGLAVLPA